MELRHLRYFLMVAEEQQFTRAALRLNIQQPPLSNQIRLLEQELGFELFRRHPKGVELTAGGEVFLLEAKAILHRVEEGAKRAARAAQGFEGSLAVGFTSSSAAHPLIPGIIRVFRELYPQVQLHLSEGSAGELTDAMVARKVNIAILRAPVARPEGLVMHRLLNEEMLLVMPVGHRLLTGDLSSDGLPTIDIGALADESFILTRRPGSFGMYSKFIDVCEASGFMPKIAFEVERMMTNINLVAAGAGISVVPASMQGFHRNSVVYCRIGGARPKLLAPVTMLCAADDLNPTTQNFVALAKTSAVRYRKQT